MLSKEEKEALLILNNIECNRLSDTENEAIVIISNLIEKLESNKQELIEKLEETRNNLKKDGFIGYSDEIQEILEILKGEKE